ncbi:hypothetical protein BCF44_14133 [Kutzneria buriramensis]|uniref:Uncharacterized protein n=1 Tax=Kutzneria buriramensis TaxID=1045776 RepID=A0A3E0G5H4_9PSEU|nr:hypothetical protein BCF44_14133 [Kutzneria buriramensis]
MINPTKRLRLFSAARLSRYTHQVPPFTDPITAALARRQAQQVSLEVAAMPAPAETLPLLVDLAAYSPVVGPM